MLEQIRTACAVFAANLLAIAVLACPSIGHAVEPPPPSAAVEEQLSRILKGFNVQSLKPGYGLCLFNTSGPIWSSYQGSADLEGRTPFSPDTRFRTGAISELLTSVRVLQLVERGKMSLEAPVARYLPAVFADAPPQSPLAQVGALKVGTILSHLSGASANLFLKFRGYTPLQNIKPFLEGTHQQFPPGTKYTHASGFIDLLGLAVQEVETRPFEVSMRESLFDPLGMASSSFQYRDDPRNAAMRYRTGQEDEYLAQIDDWNRVQVPSGSMVSSLKDLVAFYAMVLGHGSWNGRAILSPELVSAMLSSQSDEVAQRQGIRVGYVWMLSLPELAHLGRVAWYSGKFIAHRNVVILAEDLGIGVAVATNSWNISDRHLIFPLAVEILKTYAAEALGKAAPAPMNRRTVTLPADLGRRVAGVYVSPFGVYRVTVEQGRLGVTSNGSTDHFGYSGENQFLPEGSAEIERMVFSPPASFIAFLRNGIIVSASRAEKSAHAASWNGSQGTYRLANRSDFQKVSIYAFTIISHSGFPIIQGDDAKEYWIHPSSRRTAAIVCHEASPFFGKALKKKGEKELLLGGVPFRRIGWSTQ